MQFLSAQDILDAIGDVSERVPQLTVSTGYCHGRDWLVDTTGDIVYVSSDLVPPRWGQALMEALDALCIHHQVPARGPLLRLIPALRDDRTHARTGTSD